MNLSPSTRSRIATQIADSIRLTTIGYGAVATPVDHAGYPEAAVVAIAETGKTDCTAKVAVYRDRLVYASATGTHVSYPTRQEDAGRIILSFLSMERD
jgi:hypothetical protein|nr:MAG TPA: hypothetical protein [Caudoviricetes sp.]